VASWTRDGARGGQLSAPAGWPAGQHPPAGRRPGRQPLAAPTPGP